MTYSRSSHTNANSTIQQGNTQARSRGSSSSGTSSSGTSSSGTSSRDRVQDNRHTQTRPFPHQSASPNGPFFSPTPQQLPGLQEIEALRQVHALEHATVWLLSNHPEISTESHRRHQLQDDGRLSGLSTHYGFYLYGPATTARTKWAAATALDRLKAGDHHLAIHPRCGTNLATQLLLTSGIALGISSLLPKRPLEQLAGLGVSAATAQLLTNDVGTWCQTNLTTAIPHNLRIVQVTQTTDFWGRSAHFVRTHWVNESR